MQTKCGGLSRAASHWTVPRYEPPIMPTRPLDHGWRAIHSTVSYPSAAFWKKKSNSHSAEVLVGIVPVSHVRRAYEDCRKRSSGGRNPDIRSEMHAVPHRDPHSKLRIELGECSRCRPACS